MDAIYEFEVQDLSWSTETPFTIPGLSSGVSAGRPTASHATSAFENERDYAETETQPPSRLGATVLVANRSKRRSVI
ncbi:hypothetical protein [Mesorhizobium sp. M0410]|uniref:hypothetical protein n=1 Tax=unclassified Mesorhizobium TaxID=325217 RepID=UPI00333B3F50